MWNPPFLVSDIETNPNSRYCCLTFTPTEDGVIHGFAGYFDSVLYGKVDMSKFAMSSFIAYLHNIYGKALGVAIHSQIQTVVML